MVEVTDITLLEAQGDYAATCRIMEEETSVSWMLRSDAYVNTNFIASIFVLHCWSDGKVVIFETDHPLRMDAPDDDIRELMAWTKNNGWEALYVDDRLLIDRRGFDYWQRMYQAGMIENNKLKEHETAENERLTKAYLLDQKEDDDDVS